LKKINLIHLLEAVGENISLGALFNKLPPLYIKVPDGFAKKALT
jgi:hypothetical protein